MIFFLLLSIHSAWLTRDCRVWVCRLSSVSFISSTHLSAVRWEKNGAERVSTRTSDKWNANKLISNKLSTFIYDYDLLQQTAHNGRTGSGRAAPKLHIYDYTIFNAFRNGKMKSNGKKSILWSTFILFRFISYFSVPIRDFNASDVGRDSANTSEFPLGGFLANGGKCVADIATGR